LYADLRFLGLNCQSNQHQIRRLQASDIRKVTACPLPSLCLRWWAIRGLSCSHKANESDPCQRRLWERSSEGQAWALTSRDHHLAQFTLLPSHLPLTNSLFTATPRRSIKTILRRPRSSSRHSFSHTPHRRTTFSEGSRQLSLGGSTSHEPFHLDATSFLNTEQIDTQVDL
jgi:hypothetical protein